MLTVGGLVADCGLKLAAGKSSARRPVRWVHVSEHEDPTPWLSGGELLLTTGYNLGTPAKQRRYVELLAAKGLAGLGFGVGFDHKRMPKAILDKADELELPLFEVPYEMPFIAITERAAARLVNEQYDVLERGAQVHERLERLVIEGDGLDEILTSTSSAISGSALVRIRADACSPAIRAAKGSRPEPSRARRGDCGPLGRRRPRRLRARSRVARRAGLVRAGARRARRRSGRLADRGQRRRAARRLRAPDRAPGFDRRRPGADARARRSRDRTPARRRPARGRARRPPRRRGAARAPAPGRARPGPAVPDLDAFPSGGRPIPPGPGG